MTIKEWFKEIGPQDITDFWNRFKETTIFVTFTLVMVEMGWIILETVSSNDDLSFFNTQEFWVLLIKTAIKVFLASLLMGTNRVRRHVSTRNNTLNSEGITPTFKG